MDKEEGLPSPGIHPPERAVEIDGRGFLQDSNVNYYFMTKKLLYGCPVISREQVLAPGMDLTDSEPGQITGFSTWLSLSSNSHS